jgi:hypothetical protein
MEQNKTTNSAQKTLDWDKILAYGTMVFLALLSFNFGGSKWTYILEAVGFIIAAGFLGLVPSHLDKTAKKSLLVYAIPLLVFAVFSSFSNFWLGSGFASLSAGIINAVGIVAFFLIGYLSHTIKGLKFEYILFAILAGLGLLVLISMIATLVEYGPFYAIKYAGMVRFYDANYYQVNQEYAFLYGFEIVRMSVRYSMQFAFVLAVSLLSLLFISPKKEKLLFIVVAVSGGIGLLAMILVPFVAGFKLLIPAVLVALVLRFVKFPEQTPKWEKILFYVVLGLGILVLLGFFVIGLSGSSSLAKPFGKLGTNRYMTTIYEIIDVTFHKNSTAVLVKDFSGIFGMANDKVGLFDGGSVSISFFTNNRVFEFTAIYEGGLFAFLGLVALLVFAIISFRKYFHSEETLDGKKIFVFLFVFSYVLFNSFESDCIPLIDSPTTYISPLTRNSLFLVMLFFLGYSYTPIFTLKDKSALKEDEDND